MQIDLDEEELLAVIDFQKQMREGAIDSCEYEEAERRRLRIGLLENVRGYAFGLRQGFVALGLK